MSPIPRSDFLRAFTIVAATAFSPACIHAADQIQERVVDSGLAAPKNGIPGVQVTMVDRKTGKMLGDAITDGDGHYTVDINAPAKAQVIGLFSKAKYYADPARMEIEQRTAPQPPVSLSLSGQPNVYYEKWASTFLKARTAAPEQLPSLYVAIASLPQQDKDTVYASIRMNDPDALKSLQSVDYTFKSVQATSKEIKVFKPDANVVPWIDADGKGRIYGNTGSSKDKKDIEKIVMAKDMKQFRLDQDDIRVVRQ